MLFIWFLTCKIVSSSQENDEGMITIKLKTQVKGELEVKLERQYVILVKYQRKTNEWK